MKSSAIAHSNIALIKYWGRSKDHDPNLNIPLNDTVSMTKYGLGDGIHLQTHTTIEFSSDYYNDIVTVEGQEITGRHLERIIRVVDHLRAMAKRYAMVLNTVCPESRELSLAITKLEECVFWANAAIARNE